jgi:hypothetical protein
MKRVTVFRRSRWQALLAIIALAALVLLLLDRVMGQDGAEVVADSASRRGWKTIEYRGVRVDIPQDWERSDRDDCEFHFEHWGPLESAGCYSDEGVAFYSSATFDPAHGPGVRHADPRGARGSPWGGWTSGGDDYDVHAADPEREVVKEVLDSVRQD